ncbi:MAG TPA: HlyD family efflux transporter periplasmic adaptor subunit [Roseiflexaceae bacterium]|nr:HlyD family efflux transporter periplasmic adaptor subunit [Roseiflexaceae bacterium]
MRISAPFPQTGSRPRVRRRVPRWLIVPILLLIAAIVAWQWQAGNTTMPSVTTAMVSQGSLTAIVSGSGAVAAARTVELPFQQAGTVTEVLVQVGDMVATDQVLARMDTAALELQLQQAEANLRSAQAQLATLQSGSASAEDLAAAQAQFASAQAQLEQTRSGTTTAADLRSAQATLEAAQARLDALTNPDQADLATAQRSVTQAQTSLQQTRDSASQAKTNAEIAMQNAVNALTQAQSRYASAKGNWEFVQETGQDPSNPETTNAAGQRVKNMLNDAQRQQYYDTFVQAEAALRSAENGVNQAAVAFDAARQNEVSQIQQAELALANAEANLTTLLNPSQNDRVQAQTAVTQAQAGLDKLRQGGTAAAIAAAEASVVQAQANLSKLTTPAGETELAAAEASVMQARVNLDTAQRNLAAATLTAPFDGVVAAVAITPAGRVAAGAAAVTMVDRSTLHVDVSLSESDVAGVQVGQPVELSFDALPDLMVRGTVATVSPIATIAQNVVTYPVRVAFEPGTAAIKVGMSATADIEIERVDDAILVPSRAIQTTGEIQMVQVLRGETTQLLRVETGLVSNGQTQITGCIDRSGQDVACLQAGDTLQIAATSSSTTPTTRSSIGGFGAGPPMIP